MNTFTRGLRNAFRNYIRTVAVVIILGLSIGLALTMLIARSAVNNKVAEIKGTVGNTITIQPQGFSGFSSVNNSLTTSQLKPVSSLAHVTAINETLTDRLTTIGSASLPFGGQSSASSNNSTSLTSPAKLRFNSHRLAGSAGGGFFISGGGNEISLPPNFSLPVSIIGTNNTYDVNNQPISLSSGKQIDGNVDTSTALISNAMASKNSLKIGSTFTAYGAALTVAGIYSSSNNALNDAVIVALPTEQRLSGQSGDVTEAIVSVDSVDNLASVTNAVKKQLGNTANITNSIEVANNEVNPLNSVESISLYSLIGAVIAGGIIILLVMVLIVRERRREIAVTKAIGASNSTIAAQFGVEAATLTALGAIVGILIGLIAANPITKLLVNNTASTSGSGFPGGGLASRFGGGLGRRFASAGRGLGGIFRNNITNIHAAIGWSILIYGLVAALVIALIGSIVISFVISKIRPAEVLRSE